MSLDSEVDDNNNTDGFFLLGYLQVPDLAPFFIQQSNPSTYDPYLILPTRSNFANIIPQTMAPLDRREIVGLTSLASKPLYLRQHMQNHNTLVAEFRHEVKRGNPSAIQIQQDRRRRFHKWNNERRLALGLPRDSDSECEDDQVLLNAKPFETRMEPTVSAWSGLFMTDDDDDGEVLKLERAAKKIHEEKAIDTRKSWMFEDELKEISKVQQRIASRAQHEEDKKDQMEQKARQFQAHRQAKCVTHNGWPCDVNTIWDWNGNYKDAGMYSHPVILGFKFR